MVCGGVRGGEEMEGRSDKRRWREEEVGIRWSLWYSDKQNGGGERKCEEEVIREGGGRKRWG